MIIKQAQIKDGKLSIDGVEVDDITLMSRGAGDSSGQVIIGDGIALYLVDTQPDLQYIMNQLSDVCDQLKTIGDNQYVTGANGQVMGTPLKSVSSKASDIKNKIKDLKLR